MEKNETVLTTSFASEIKPINPLVADAIHVPRKEFVCECETRDDGEIRNPWTMIVEAFNDESVWISRNSL